MPNIIISPNMGMPVPVPGVDPGPDWANNIVACLSIIDQHNHSPSQGVLVTPSGININANLQFNGLYAATLGAAAFSAQTATLASSVTKTLYVASSDLYFNDGSGNVVRLTQGGAVPGSSGTITGLPSGTASASYAAGTFTFQSATNTPASMNVGPLVVGAAVANSKTATIAPPSGLGSNYNLTLFSSLPGATSLVTLTPTGDLASSTTTTHNGDLTVTGTLAGGALSTSGAFSAASVTASGAVTGGSLSTAGTIAGASINVTASGAIKIAAFTGTLNANTTTTLAVPGGGTMVAGYGIGYDVGTASSYPIPSLGWAGTPGANAGLYFVNASTAQSLALNNSRSGQTTYRVVMFYI